MDNRFGQNMSTVKRSTYWQCPVFLKKDLFYLADSAIEGRETVSARICGIACGEVGIGLPSQVCRVKGIVRLLTRATESAPVCLCGGDTLCLTLFDILTFILSDKWQYLQNEVGDKRTDEILTLSCIEQGHIDHADVYADILGEDLPLREDLVIISAEAIDTQDVEKIAFWSISTILVYCGRLKSFPDCLSEKMFSAGTLWAFIATSCLSSFWSVLDTRT